MNILHVDHFCIHSDIWEIPYIGFPCINLFANVFLVRTWNLLHMDADTISKDQTSVFNEMHIIPFHSLLPNGLLLAMGFTSSLELIILDWLSTTKYRKGIGLHSHSNIYNVFFLNHSTILVSRWNSATYSAWWIALI